MIPRYTPKDHEQLWSSETRYRTWLEVEPSVWVTRTGAIVGTAHYMSPEQARGERGLDQRADVYGLGALLYEMIAGIPPFLGATPFAVLTSLLTEAPVPPSHLMQGIPPALDALVIRALAKSPQDRPYDVPTFGRELVAIV